MSTLKVSSIQNLSGVEVYTAKAWVNFNGVGTISIRGSGNVASITDNGVGDYTVNFTNALADANYATFVSCGMTNSTSAPIIGTISAIAASTGGRRFTINNGNNGTATDHAEIDFCIFR